MESKTNTLRIAGITEDSIVDGPGLRLVVFAQGCLLRCPGCHNPSTHPIDGGYETTPEEILGRLKRNPLTDGITISGGEPFLQSFQFAQVAKEAKRSGLNVWVYTGHTFEELLLSFEQNPDWKELLQYTDVLVDGPFILELKSLEIPFRGSRNQRLLDAQKSLACGIAVLYDESKYR